jgi:catechol 2,3-dioxygenase-like lactoylglutathione lyase family enzyme
MIKRLSAVDLAVSDLRAAVDTLQRNFGLKLDRTNGDVEAVLSIGGAAIRLITSSQASTRPASGSEGMVGLWLEAQDVAAVTASLARAGFGELRLKVEPGRRVLEVAPAGPGEPWLFIFDRHV